MIRPPSTPTLFPYTTLFRSKARCRCRRFLIAVRAATKRLTSDMVRTPDLLCIAQVGPFPRRTMRNIAKQACSRSEEHTSELQSHSDLVCRLLLEKKKQQHIT